MDVRLTLRWVPDRPLDSSAGLCVVADILRGSTTTVVALQSKAECVIPASELNQARQLARQHKALLVGERYCRKPIGFDLGNSPAGISESIVQGKKIVFSSTNFPRAISMARNAPVVLIGCMLNVSALAKVALEIASRRCLHLTLVLAGEKDKHADEELAFAGMFASVVENSGVEMSPEIEQALAYVRKKGAETIIGECEHAAHLVRLGMGNDVEYATRTDIFNIVPIFIGGRIIPYSADLGV